MSHNHDDLVQALDMDDLWTTAIPNWITALTTVIAVVLAAVGAWAAWRSLQSQLDRDAEDRRAAIAAEARMVTAQWVRRWRRPALEGQSERLEWGLLLTNYGTTPAFEVEIEALAKGTSCALPVIDPLQPGEIFVRRDTSGPDSSFTVKRMGTDVVRTEPIFSREWLVKGVSFLHEGRRLRWRSRETPSAERGVS